MTLLFIYNADAGLIADLKGAAMKLLKEKNDCSLCSITYGIVNEKPIWTEFLKSLDILTVVYHRDDIPAEVMVFLKEKNVALPVVLSKEGSGLSVLVGSKEMDDCGVDAECLIKIIRDRLSAVSD